MNTTESQQTVEMPDALNCPSCKTVLNMMTGVLGEPQFRKGLLIVCSSCGAPLKVGDSMLVRLSRGEFDKLSPDMKAGLASACLAVKQRLEKQKSG